MERKPRNILAAALLLLATSVATVHQSQVDATQRHQQELNTALCDAIIFKRVASVRDLLRRGADPNCRQQPASLKEQVENSSPIIWRLFHGAEAPDLYLTPLGLAVLNPQPKIVKALLDAGANPNEKDSDGQTPRDIDANGQDRIYWVLKTVEAKQEKLLP